MEQRRGQPGQEEGEEEEEEEYQSTSQVGGELRRGGCK